MKRKAWISWVMAGAVTAVLGIYLGLRLTGEDKTVFVPGAMTDGHHQIEAACDACHTPFGGVKQDACLKCHGAELAAVEDSHPRKKFDDPRNADLLKSLDARHCVTCHEEHRPDKTRAMGVTLAGDFCFRCHADVAKDRPSHKGFAFDSCASSGCHHFHDNKALYEEFLDKHLHEPEVAAKPLNPARHLVVWIRAAGLVDGRPLSAAQQDSPADASADPHLIGEWTTTAHARAGVNCSGCHRSRNPATQAVEWVKKPTRAQCARCHEAENDGFLEGKHGMRLKQNLPPMRPALARLPMKHDAADKELGCVTCHGAHTFDTHAAAVDACLGCHDDEHSRTYRNSPHFRLWQAELKGTAPRNSGVSCATCHLPREIHRQDGMDAVRVQHDQNLNLRPRDKMVRSVCLNCHGLGFSLDALADTALVARNFAGHPARHVRSLDMAELRLSQPHPQSHRKETIP